MSRILSSAGETVQADRAVDVFRLEKTPHAIRAAAWEHKHDAPFFFEKDVLEPIDLTRKGENGNEQNCRNDQNGSGYDRV